MRWGAIVRGESRGLGNLTSEVYRNLHPDKTLLVDMGVLARGFRIVHDYPDATRVMYDGGLPEDTCRTWLKGLDVLWTAETFYDDRIIEWAADAGVRTVNLVMPEFFRIEAPRADVIWNPTSWRHDSLPDGAEVIRVPVAADRFQTPDVRNPGPIRVLHNMGHRAAMDRNGTSLFLASLRYLRTSAEVEVIVSGQDGRLPVPPRTRPNIRVTNRVGGTVNYWDAAAGADILVMPRRYGGLCLPVQEAMAAGAVPVMPDVSPNRDWPVEAVASVQGGGIATPGGAIPLAHCDPKHIAEAVDRLADDPDLLESRRGGVLAWAESNSWDACRDGWLARLDGVAHPKV